MKSAAVTLAALLGLLITACENKNAEPTMTTQDSGTSSGRYATTTSPPPAYTYNDTGTSSGSGTYATTHAPAQDAKPTATTYDAGSSDERLTAAPRSSTPRSTTKTTGSSGSASAGGKSYTVQKGDTLSGIAKKFYNDPNKWQKIYQANKGKLKNANDLKVGQTLTIP